MQDAAKKGRMVRGEHVHSSRLAKQQVLDIHDDTRIARIIGEEYGISNHRVYQIKAEKVWKHLFRYDPDTLAEALL